MALKPRTAPVVLYQGDDEEHIYELRTQLIIAQADLTGALQRTSGSPKRLGEPEGGADVEKLRGAVDAAQVELDTFIDQAAGRAEEFRVQAIGRSAFRDLRHAHPARKVSETIDGEERLVVHPDDQQWAVNTDTFGRALLAFVDRDDDDHRTLVAPVLTEQQLTKLLDRELAEGNFVKLWQTAYGLNASVGADPKAWRSSAPTPTSGETSVSPDRLG